jgi:hypothetical protein
MLNLSKVVVEADSPAVVADVLKRELEKVDGKSLPLQQGLSHSSYTDGQNFGVTVLSVQREANGLRAKVGILYQGLIAGCACADDPTAASTIDEYCELELIIRESGDTIVRLLEENQ